MGMKVVIVLISPLENDQFQASIRVAGRSSVSEVFRIPPLLMEEVWPNWPNQREHLRNINDSAPSRVKSDSRELGRALFDAVFANHVELVGGEEPLRLCLEFQVPKDPHYAARMALAYEQPWELLHDGIGFLALRGCHILRQVEGLTGIHTRKSLWLRILVVAANPNEHGLLELRKEMDELQRSLRWSRIFPVFLDQANPNSLQRALEDHYDVVHFMGHGSCDSNSANFFLENADGQAHPLSAASLVHVLSAVLSRNRPQLVVLNACDGAVAFQDRNAVRGMAHDLAAAGIPAVVAMRREIRDQSAVTFAAAFYRALAARKAIEQAVGLGRVAVEAQQPWLDEWSVPTLFSHHRDGRLLLSARDMLYRLLPLVAVLSLFLLYWFTSATKIILEPGEVAIQSTLSRTGRILETRGLDVQTHGFSGNRFRVEQDQRHLTLTGGRYFCGLPLWRWGFQVSTTSQSDSGELAQKLAWILLQRLGRPARDLELNQQGLDLWDEDEFEQARQLFEQALSINPNLAEAHNNLALLLFRMGLRDEARGHAAKAVKLASAVQDFRYNLASIEGATIPPVLDDHLALLHEAGKILLERRQYAAAGRALRRCIELDPGFAPAHKNLGRLLFSQNRLLDAREALERALELTEQSDPARLETLLWQARCCRDLGDVRASREALIAFASIPEAAYSELWPTAVGLAEELALPIIRPTAVARVGLVGAVEGDALLLVDGRRTLDPRYARVLTSAMSVSLQAGAAIVVIRSDDRVCRLQGPGLWTAAELLQAPSEGPFPLYYQQLAAGMQTDAAFAGDYQVLKSRGEEDEVVVLAPAGVAGAVPEVVWVEVPGAVAYVFEIEGADGELRQQALPVAELRSARRQLGGLVYYAHPWLWADLALSVGRDHTLSIQAIGEELAQTPTAVAFKVVDHMRSGIGPLDEAASPEALSYGALLAERANEPGLAILYRLAAARSGASIQRLELAELLARRGQVRLVELLLDPVFRQHLEPQNTVRASRCLDLARQLGQGG